MKSKLQLNLYPAISLTKITMAFVIISNRDQAKDRVEIMLTRTGMAFATTALMLGRSQEILAGMGKETSTGMVRGEAADVVIIAGDKSLVVTEVENYIFE